MQVKPPFKAAESTLNPEVCARAGLECSDCASETEFEIGSFSLTCPSLPGDGALRQCNDINGCLEYDDNCLCARCEDTRFLSQSQLACNVSLPLLLL